MMKDNIFTKKNKKFKTRKHLIKEFMRILILSFNKHKKVLRVMLAVDCFWPSDKYSCSKIKLLTSCEIMIASRNPVVAANSTQRSNICRHQQTLQWNRSGDQMSVTAWGYPLTSSHPWCFLLPPPIKGSIKSNYSMPPVDCARLAAITPVTRSAWH